MLPKSSFSGGIVLVTWQYATCLCDRQGLPDSGRCYVIATMFCKEGCGWSRERQAAGKSRDEALNELKP